MRIFSLILCIAVVFLQYRVWVSEQGIREVARLSAAVLEQTAANVEQRERNRQLAAEVNDLKGGLTALEERARSELGMVGNSETFYQVVTAAIPVPRPPASAPARTTAAAITARAR